MSANAVLLSTMMSDLSAQPGFDDKFIAALRDQSKTGAAVLSPRLLDALRATILRQDWNGLDRFPGWKMRDIDPAVDAAGVFARKTKAGPSRQPKQPITAYIDLGNPQPSRRSLHKSSPLSLATASSAAMAPTCRSHPCTARASASHRSSTVSH
jgi:hypothetical protein